MQPVGKSGPCTNCNRSSVAASGFSIRWIAASHTSRKLCGGMLVAMPTAMPSVPFKRRFGMAAGKHGRLFLGVVIICGEVDRFFIDIAQHFSCEARHFGFGVAVGRGAVAVDGAEVALADDERIAHREILRHFDHRVVDGRVAVRVVFAEHVTDDGRRLFCLRRNVHARLVHRIQDAAVHRLQSVAHVRERARGDDRHRVVEVRLAHFRRDRARHHIHMRRFRRLIFGLFFVLSACHKSLNYSKNEAKNPLENPPVLRTFIARRSSCRSAATRRCLPHR